jgi:hypothetical protein
MMPGETKAKSVRRKGQERVRQPILIAVGPPSVAGVWRGRGLDPRTPGAEAQPTTTGNRVVGEAPPGKVYQ